MSTHCTFVCASFLFPASFSLRSHTPKLYLMKAKHLCVHNVDGTREVWRGCYWGGPTHAEHAHDFFLLSHTAFCMCLFALRLQLYIFGKFRKSLSSYKKKPRADLKWARFLCVAGTAVRKRYISCVLKVIYQNYPHIYVDDGNQWRKKKLTFRCDYRV